MALGIVQIYLGSQFSANRRCSRSVVVDPAGRGGVKVINYLLVAAAKNHQNKNINKENRIDDEGYAAAFSASIASYLCRKNI